MENSPWRELRSLIPNTIAVYFTKEEYEGNKGVGTGAPVDDTKPFKPWRDNAAFYPGSSWFGGSAPMAYNTFAVDAAGDLVLSPYESSAAMATYSGTVINVYREYRHLFPKGVPVLVPMLLSRKEASEFNYGYNGKYTPPPAIINTNQMLAPGPGGEWMVIDYQAWIQIQRSSVNTMTDQQKVAKAVEIGLNQGLAVKDKIAAMRLVLQETPNLGPVT